MSEQVIRHFPVMATNVVNFIKRSKIPSKFYAADCNFGFGGHTSLVLKHFPNAFV